ncbi:MAG: hypothetical protein M1833_000306 [Piccolia ochrophora]|nr:MAG: hypothetical protein M1833_000306 [Piccolia ochrophora]
MHVQRGLHLSLPRAPQPYLPRSLLDPEHSLVERSPPGEDNSVSGGGSSGSSSDSKFGGSSDSSDSSTTTSSSFGSSNTCAEGDTRPKCQKKILGGNGQTLAIALAVVIPIVVAVVIFFFLHRRHLRKLRSEDLNDKHKSLDFGLDQTAKPASSKKWRKGKAGPEMSTADINVTEKSIRRGHGHGMSLDMDIGSPYLLPPGLQSSRESLHSLSRTMHNGDDRYRPATTFIPNDTSSMRSYPPSVRRFNDDGSSLTGSSRSPQDGMNHELLRNASRMSRSSPPFHQFPLPSNNSQNAPSIRAPEPVHGVTRKDLPKAPGAGGLMVPSQPSEESRDSYIDKDGGDMRRSNNYLGAFINHRDSHMDSDNVVYAAKSAETDPQLGEQKLLPTLPELAVHGTEPQQPPAHPVQVGTAPPRPGRPQSMNAPVLEMPHEPNFLDDESDYGDGVKVTPATPNLNANHQSGDYNLPYEDKPLPPVHEAPNALAAPETGYDVRRLSMGFRPLPPEDPTDDPEQRANRIRSFYKEYFDESRPGPFREGEAYYEDYGQEYLGEAPFFDPDTGNFVMAGAPYAQPYARRAMTPPPRAPPRFRGAHRNQYSASGFSASGPRAFSSASGRFPPMGPRGRQPGPQKALPPPTPLRVLPTPHLLKEDSFALPIDFAPPRTYKDRQAGRPESPLGGMRPYSPALPAHLPLQSSFDDLSVMPSPHALRRSGTFTALDFAPPPRFKNSDAGSDAGSIRSGRSNRSAMSATQLHNIRTGAYRVSRLPKDFVGTKADITTSLRPTWDMK